MPGSIGGMVSPDQLAYWTREMGPRRIGGRYYSDYRQQEYTVTDLRALPAPAYGWSITCHWADGTVTTHSTSWDYKRDRIIEQPVGVVELPEGYNGHTIKCFADPLLVDGDLALLQVAEPGKEYMVKWARQEVIV